MPYGRWLATLALCVAASGTIAQTATYDALRGELRLSAVQVGAAVYTNVVLKDTGGFRFVLQAASLQSPPTSAPAGRYEPASRLLRVPLVRGGTVSYNAVVLADEGNLVFSLRDARLQPTTPALASTRRWLEAWSTANADPRSGTFDLAVADPDVPGQLVPVARTNVANLGARRLHVLGGGFDPVSGQVTDPGVRQLVYVEDGRIVNIDLERGAIAPTPRQVSTETSAEGPLALVAQNAKGSTALLQYQTRSSTLRYVLLSDDAGTAPRTAPVFGGDVFALGHLAAIPDPATGEMIGHLWSSLTPASQVRVFRTGPDLSGQATLAQFRQFEAFPRSAQGLFFLADGALRRYDFALGVFQVVFEGVIERIGTSLIDDDSFHLRVQTAAGPVLLRCADAVNVQCSAIASGSILTARAVASMAQTRDYLLLVAPDGTTITSVHKGDGSLAQPTVPDGSLRSWLSLTQGNANGNRLVYFRVERGTLRNLIGSVQADGSERRELDGTPWAIVGLPSGVAMHRLGVRPAEVPMARLLVRTSQGDPTLGSDSMGWLDATEGQVIGLGGTIASRYLRLGSTFGVSPPYSQLQGRTATVGLQTDVVSSQTGATSTRVESYMLSELLGVVRLTTVLP